MTKRRLVTLISAGFVSAILLGIIYELYASPWSQSSQLVGASTTGFPVVNSQESDYYVPDSTAGHVHKPYAVRVLEWKEHPKGSIRMAVNNLGFRDDVDTVVAKPRQTYRILVTGDSHIDGVIYNTESFAKRLEAMMNAGDQKASFEVLNGGTGYYGPYHYAGFLRKFLYLKPDMFLVVFYTGNDFLDGVTTAEIRHRVHIAERPADYYRALTEAGAESQGAVSQALNQAYFFKTYPDLEPIAVDIADEQMFEIAHTCDGAGIRLLVVTLPTKGDMPNGNNKATYKNARAKLGLTLGDVEVNRRMGDRLLIKLSKAGIPTLDPLDEMQQVGDELFWETDYHLNHTGHNLLARIVFSYLKRSL